MLTRPVEPAYRGPPAPRDEDRRLLLITFTFAPSNGIGSRRWLETARLLAEEGWAIDVIASNEGLSRHAQMFEGALVDRIPAGCRVYHAPWNPHPVVRGIRGVGALRDLGRDLRAAVNGSSSSGDAPTHRSAENADRRRAARAREGGVSCARDTVPRSSVVAGAGRWDLRRLVGAWLAHNVERPWAVSAVEVAEDLLRRHAYRAVITSGPPHVAYDVGRVVARDYGLPLVVDMRDPCATQETLSASVAHPLWFRIAERRERRAIEDSAVVLVTTEALAETLREKYAVGPGRIRVMMNGWDDRPASRRTPERFTIAYTGSLYLDRDPATIIRPFARLVGERGLDPGEAELVFLGYHAHPGRLSRLARQVGVEDHVRFEGWAEHSKVDELLGRSCVKVSLEDSRKDAIQAKVYEYLVYPGTTLVLTETDSAAARILAGLPVDLVRPSDEEGAYRVLERAWKEYRDGVHRPPLRPPRLSRRRQARVILGWLEKLESRSLGPSRTAARPVAGVRAAARGRVALFW